MVLVPISVHIHWLTCTIYNKRILQKRDHLQLTTALPSSSGVSAKMNHSYEACSKRADIKCDEMELKAFSYLLVHHLRSIPMDSGGATARWCGIQN
jgi:hypothetical protein